MHETSAGTWCSGRTWRERVWREVGGGIGMGKTCEPKAFSFQCMTKFTTKKKNLPPTALRAFWPVPTLRNAASSSPLRPLLLVAGVGVWGYFSAGSCF